MKTLIYKSDAYSSGFEELLGHGCQTDDEIEDYAVQFEGSFLVVDAPFDPGTFIPEDQRPKKDPFPGLTAKYEGLDEAGKKRMMEGIDAVLAALKKPF